MWARWQQEDDLPHPPRQDLSLGRPHVAQPLHEQEEELEVDGQEEEVHGHSLSARKSC